MLFDGTRDWYNNLMFLGFFVTREETMEKGRTEMEKYCPVFEKVKFFLLSHVQDFFGRQKTLDKIYFNFFCIPCFKLIKI